MSAKNTNLHQVGLTQLMQSLGSFYENRIPLYLWGRPSTGKTSSVRQFAKEKAKELGLKYSEDIFGPEYFTMKVITLSQYDSPDLRGMPQVTKGSNNGAAVTEFVPTAELPRDGQGILFFDEMNLADDQTRAACYQLILEGRYGAMPAVMDKDGNHMFWRIAASNRENDFSSVNITSLALLRRFAHLEIEPKIEEVLAYFMSKQFDSRVVAFLKNFPEELFPQKWDEKLTENKANPFPSTWEHAARLIEKINIKDENVMFSLTASCVGAAVSSKFINYVKLISKLDMESILDKPKESLKELLKSQDKASLLYAVIYNFGARWYKKDKRLTPKKCVEILETLPSEFAVSFITVLVKTREQELVSLPEMDKMLVKLGKFFNF